MGLMFMIDNGFFIINVMEQTIATIGKRSDDTLIIQILVFFERKCSIF